MRRTWLCLLAALAASPARGQSDIPIPAGETIERMCSPAGTYQFAFGETGVPGGSKLMRTISRGSPLPASAAPFENAKPWSTEWTDRLFAMEYIAPVLEEDAFTAFAKGLDAVLTQAGWQSKPADYDPPFYMLTVTGERTWTRPDPTTAGAAELVLGLTNGFAELVLACGRSDLMLAHVQEALGELPPGTPRPVEPAIPIVPVPTVADCASPEIAAEIDAFLADGNPGSFARSLFARANHEERLSQWMMWRLGEAGASDDELLELAMNAAMLDGEPEGFEASLDAFMGLLPLITALDDAQRAGDRDGVCRALVSVTEIYARMAANGTVQTRALEAAYRREAPKYGIDPDE